jgi:UDP-glucose 4-epimerase
MQSISRLYSESSGTMSTLVTGGAGYIGSHLVDVLCQAGHKVRVLDPRPIGRQHLADPAFEWVEGLTADPECAACAAQDIDVVCHLAWGFHPDQERREVQQNLLGTLTLLEAALTAGVRHLIFASSAVVYGPTGPVKVSEKQPCHPERSTIGGAQYGITKLACEKLCLVHQRRGLPVTIFRIHGVFGKGRLGQFGRMIDQAFSGETVSAIRQAGGEYIHLDDVLQAFLVATANPKSHGQIFNLAGLHTYRDADLARFIVEATGSKSQVGLIESPTEQMVSVSVERLHRFLGYAPRREDFLTELIQRALTGV